MPNNATNPAITASNEAFAEVLESIEAYQSFVLEAGAGAGKTYTLVETLKYLIKKQAVQLLKENRHIACITYTNVAKDEINSRIDNHPAVFTGTIHSFCWSILKRFQSTLKKELPSIGKWEDRLKDIEDINSCVVIYDSGYPTVKDNKISLYHGDVLSLMTKLLEIKKFRHIVASEYPIIFIDEYQDTNKDFAEALRSAFIEEQQTVLIGLFGDPWQKIYDDGCGDIIHNNLRRIGLRSNFRCTAPLVIPLNRIRPELPQEVVDPKSTGTTSVFHTNNWKVERRTERNWKDDLPVKDAHKALQKTKQILTEKGWDFSPKKTKILMLTHNTLATEQGYSSLIKTFPNYRDDLIKKGDPHIAFLVDKLEPACLAFFEQRYGEAFGLLGQKTPLLTSQAGKEKWKVFMDCLNEKRKNETVGAVLNFLLENNIQILPEKVKKREEELRKDYVTPNDEEPSYITRLRNLHSIAYNEVIALDRFIDEMTPFSTKHGVKGAEYENVLVVFGKGWNYNFDKFLTLRASATIPAKQQSTYERNRNLFYVACSRPKKNLALLFTHTLSDSSIETLEAWFDEENIATLDF